MARALLGQELHLEAKNETGALGRVVSALSRSGINIVHLLAYSVGERGYLQTITADNAKAKDYIGQALRQKNNYTDAIFLLAQIQVQEGNIKDAINSVAAASYLAPNDSGIFFQLGLLRYNDKNYAGAVDAFKKATDLNPAYANAKYFLGISYQKTNRLKEAIKEFSDLKASNPDNKEVELILENLTAGREPFANATPPIDNKPEKRSALPVSEKGAVKSKAAETAR